MLWLNLLHLYQPANSPRGQIKEALEKSYLPLIKTLKKQVNFRLSLNISACLLERLEEMKEFEFIRLLQDLLNSNQIELLGSAAFHGLLPLLTIEEVGYQIEYQEKVLARLFKFSPQASGFFFPEMAYSPDLAKLVKSRGYDWIMVSEMSAKNLREDKEPFIYLDKASGLKFLIRNQELSNSFVPETIFKLLKENNKEESPLITASDAELYGLRHYDNEDFLNKILLNPKLKSQKISDFIKEAEQELKPFKELELVPASWESDQLLDKNNVFAIWQDRKNPIHKLLWQLAFLAIRAGQLYPEDNNYYWYRWHLSRGLASCSFWWASERDFSYNFGPVAWSPNEVERGASDLVRAIRSLEDKASLSLKLKAEKLFSKLYQSLWLKHWQKYW